MTTTDTPQCTANTAAGTRCTRKPALGLAVCAVHAGLTRVGRHTKLSAEVQDRIINILRAGGYDETAAAAAGIPRQRFYDWLRRGDPAGELPENEVFRDFRTAVERARADGEVRNVAMIAQQAQTNWQAAAWLLERRHPERWARPSQRETEPRAEGAASPADPFAEVDELAQRRRTS